jgi:AcrR family transcriptional regulator
MNSKKSLDAGSNVARSSGATSRATRKDVAKGVKLAHTNGNVKLKRGAPARGSAAVGAANAAGAMVKTRTKATARPSAVGAKAMAQGIAKATAAGNTPASAEAAAAKPRVRDRILETAGELFYAHGIHCVGVDSIASEAGTNKMSLYRNFPSKEELVAEYLREQEREYWGVWDATIEAFEGDPRRQLEALFDAFLARAKSKHDDADCKVRRGCALGNAAVEIPQEDENLRSIVLAYKSELRRRLRKLSKEAGASDPDTLGDALMLLLEGGCYTLSTFSGTSGPIASMAKAARALISIHLR